LTIQSMEVFKFISLPLLAGIPLRDSWKKLKPIVKNIIFYFFIIVFFGMGWLYIDSPVQLCNNYLIIEQITLGWGFLTTAICMVIYLVYTAFVDPTEYE
jgi:TRAP-type C4-dicarboxylate transport system permease small subunit